MRAVGANLKDAKSGCQLRLLKLRSWFSYSPRSQKKNRTQDLEQAAHFLYPPKLKTVIAKKGGFFNPGNSPFVDFFERTSEELANTFADPNHFHQHRYQEEKI